MCRTHREIIAKTICGKGSDIIEKVTNVKPNHSPNSILGCWVINHKFTSEIENDQVEIDGLYDINIWYSYENNSKTEVVTKTVKYKKSIELEIVEDLYSEEMVNYTKCTQNPNCIEATIYEGEISVEVEMEFEIECIGEVKLKVVTT